MPARAAAATTPRRGLGGCGCSGAAAGPCRAYAWRGLGFPAALLEEAVVVERPPCRARARRARVRCGGRVVLAGRELPGEVRVQLVNVWVDGDATLNASPASSGFELLAAERRARGVQTAVAHGERELVGRLRAFDEPDSGACRASLSSAAARSCAAAARYSPRSKASTPRAWYAMAARRRANARAIIRDAARARSEWRREAET